MQSLNQHCYTLTFLFLNIYEKRFFMHDVISTASFISLFKVDEMMQRWYCRSLLIFYYSFTQVLGSWTNLSLYKHWHTLLSPLTFLSLTDRVSSEVKVIKTGIKKFASLYMFWRACVCLSALTSEKNEWLLMEWKDLDKIFWTIPTMYN